MRGHEATHKIDTRISSGILLQAQQHHGQPKKNISLWVNEARERDQKARCNHCRDYDQNAITDLECTQNNKEHGHQDNQLQRYKSMIAGRRSGNEFQQVKLLIGQRIKPPNRRPNRRQEIPSSDGKIGQYIVVVVSKVLFIKDQDDIEGQKDQKYDDGCYICEIEATGNFVRLYRLSPSGRLGNIGRRWLLRSKPAATIKARENSHSSST